MITLILIIALATFGVWMTLAYLKQHDKNVKEKKDEFTLEQLNDLWKAEIELKNQAMKTWSDINLSAYIASNLCERVEKTKLAEVAHKNVVKHRESAEYYEELYIKRTRKQ